MCEIRRGFSLMQKGGILYMTVLVRLSHVWPTPAENYLWDILCKILKT